MEDAVLKATVQTISSALPGNKFILTGAQQFCSWGSLNVARGLNFPMHLFTTSYFYQYIEPRSIKITFRIETVKKQGTDF
jgi:hypothetical protein